MKLCPYCAEEIQDAAVKCKHCQADLNEVAATSEVIVANKTQLREFEAWMTTTYPKWVITNKTDRLVSYQYNEPGSKGSCLIALVLLCFFLIPGILYLYFSNKTSRMLRFTVTLDGQGNLSPSGDPEGVRLYRKYEQYLERDGQSLPWYGTEISQRTKIILLAIFIIITITACSRL